MKPSTSPRPSRSTSSNHETRRVVVKALLGGSRRADESGRTEVEQWRRVLSSPGRLDICQHVLVRAHQFTWPRLISQMAGCVINKPRLSNGGLGPEIGWHTFRHTYPSWLDASGAPLKVQQELMRHASIMTTMNVYGKAMPSIKREANSKVVSMALAKEKKGAD